MGKSIIKLKNVSKYYYSKGVIATGFTKLNLEFKMGEFVAICGESGSGKSTLLNVISGLDSYEEGEMYINGSETSHYGEADFENYRRKYIGNIFQNFNLVNSYTVYQNIELVLLLNGSTKKEIKSRVIDLIKEVGLYKFRNTKVSKLSGGQKQRVAIARALAKDTPIIIADEPTGNLDSKSAKGIIKLLSEISHNKLVIIVTHNYEQVSDYVTRKIKMHDGRVLEDRKIKDIEEVDNIDGIDVKDIRLFSKIRLGVRNTFNIIPKLLLLLAVYLFITVALMAEYSFFKHQEYIEGKSGYNYMFKNTDDTRVIIKKEDKSSFSDDDYNAISNISNIDFIIKNDLLLDSSINLTDNNNYWLYGNVNNIDNLEGKLDKGRMPKEDNEVIVVGSRDDYYIGYLADEILNKEFYLENTYSGEVDKSLKLTIVGIKYIERNNYWGDCHFYVSSAVQKKLAYQINQEYSEMKVLFKDKYYNSDLYNSYFKIVPNKNVLDGNVYISSDLNYLCKNDNCINESLSVLVDNLYYEDKVDLKVSKSYTKNNFKSLVGNLDYDYYNGAIFISLDDYNELFNKNNYQSSIFVKDVSMIDKTIKLLNDKGYSTLKVSDTLVQDGFVQVVQLMRTVVTIILVVVLFFISYFVIRLILKSRNVYFTTLRMLGASKRVTRELLIIELICVANLAYLLFLCMLFFNIFNVIDVGVFNTVISYMSFGDYVLLYFILVMMSYLISSRYSSKLFKKSAMKTIIEEV